MNLCGNVVISSKRFNGINIIDYEIDYTSNEEFDYDKNDLYDKKKTYEAHIYTNRTFDYLQKQFLKDKVKIRYLQANNSIL